MENILQNIEIIKQRIAAACARVGLGIRSSLKIKYKN